MLFNQAARPICLLTLVLKLDFAFNFEKTHALDHVAKLLLKSLNC